jgi:hypothetical protein
MPVEYNILDIRYAYIELCIKMLHLHHNGNSGFAT